MKTKATLLAIAATFALTGCSDAKLARNNVKTAADQFEVMRRIVFYNGITADYMLNIEGLCSIRADKMDNQLEVTCRVEEDEYKVHFLGLSDNVTYFVEQLRPKVASKYHYRVIFKPQTILPDFDFVAGSDSFRSPSTTIKGEQPCLKKRNPKPSKQPKIRSLPKTSNLAEACPRKSGKS